MRIYPPMLAASATWLTLPTSATVVLFLPLAYWPVATLASPNLTVDYEGKCKPWE